MLPYVSLLLPGRGILEAAQEGGTEGAPQLERQQHRHEPQRR